MRIVQVMTYCTATVQEEWTFEVPDDFEIPEDMTIDDINELACAKFVDVENVKVDDERDRETTSIAFIDVAGEA